MEKRIFIVTGRTRSIINFRSELILSLIRCDYDIHLGIPKDTSDVEVEKLKELFKCRIHFLDIRRVSISPFYDLKLIFQIRKIIKNIRPSKVFSYNVKPVVYSGLACFWLNVEHTAMITGAGYALTSKKGFKRFLVYFVTTNLYKLSFLGVDKVVFQNSDDLDMFKKIGLLNKKNKTYKVNGSGVNLDKYTFSNIPNGSSVFFMVARLLGDKGVREYLSAAKAVKEMYPSVNFLLAGDFDDNPDAISPSELQPYIDQDIVIYLGRINNVAEQLQSCTTFVLPSYREGTPRSALEALAVGRPVITTLAPGCRETVIDGYNGYLVSIADAESLFTAMIKMIKNKGLIKEFGFNSYQLAKDKYDVKKVNKSMINILED